MAEPQVDVQSRIEGFLAAEDGEAPPAEDPRRRRDEEQQAQPEQDSDDEPARAEAEQQDEDEPEQPVEASEEEGEEESAPDDFAEWARFNGIEPQDMYSLKFKIHSDGELKEVTVGQMKDTYVDLDNQRREAQRVAREYQTRISQQQQAEQVYFQRLREADALNYAAEQALLGNFNSKEMQELRESDPGEYAARSQEYQRRVGEIQQYRMALNNAVNQQTQKHQAAMQEQFNRSVADGMRYLQEQNPEWKDPAKATAKKAAIREYALAKGFSQQELDMMADPRFVLVLEDAMTNWKRTAQKPVAEQAKVQHQPAKVLKPGAKRSKSATANDQYAKDRARLRRSGGNQDVAAEIFEKYFVGDM